jgi:hypothetical protein
MTSLPLLQSARWLLLLLLAGVPSAHATGLVATDPLESPDAAATAPSSPASVPPVDPARALATARLDYELKRRLEQSESFFGLRPPSIPSTKPACQNTWALDVVAVKQTLDTGLARTLALFKEPEAQPLRDYIEEQLPLSIARGERDSALDKCFDGITPVHPSTMDDLTARARDVFRRLRAIPRLVIDVPIRSTPTNALATLRPRRGDGIAQEKWTSPNSRFENIYRGIYRLTIKLDNHKEGTNDRVDLVNPVEPHLLCKLAPATSTTSTSVCALE